MISFWVIIASMQQPIDCPMDDSMESSWNPHEFPMKSHKMAVPMKPLRYSLTRAAAVSEKCSRVAPFINSWVSGRSRNGTISWWCHGYFPWWYADFSVISWWFYGDVIHGGFVVIQLWLYGDFMMALLWFHCDFLVVLWMCYGDFMVISWWFYNKFLVILWRCYGDFMVAFWWFQFHPF